MGGGDTHSGQAEGGVGEGARGRGPEREKIQFEFPYSSPPHISLTPTHAHWLTTEYM